MTLFERVEMVAKAFGFSGSDEGYVRWWELGGMIVKDVLTTNGDTIVINRSFSPLPPLEVVLVQDFQTEVKGERDDGASATDG